jgi:hypothetical protein
VGAVLVTDAIAITVRLAALDLGPIAGLVLVSTLTLLSASLREPVYGQKNHRSDEKYAVFQ